MEALTDPAPDSPIGFEGRRGTRLPGGPGGLFRNLELAGIFILGSPLRRSRRPDGWRDAGGELLAWQCFDELHGASTLGTENALGLVAPVVAGVPSTEY